MFAALKGINMKHVVYMSAEAWDDVPSTTLLKSWNKLLRRTEEIAQETDDLESSTTELQPLLTKLGCDTSEEEMHQHLNPLVYPVMVQQLRCWRNVFFGMNIKKKLNQQHFSIYKKYIHWHL